MIKSGFVGATGYLGMDRMRLEQPQVVP